MALKAILDQAAVDALPADVKKEYTKQDDNTYRLDVEPVNGLVLENVTTLKTALQTERETVKSLKKAAKAFEGLDPEVAREALTKVEEIKNFNPDQKIAEGIRQREEQLSKKHKKELEDRDTALKNSTNQLEQVLIVNAATKAILERKGDVDLLEAKVLKQVRLRQIEGGKYVAEVIDENGAARISPKAGSQDPMTISELIDEMVVKHPRAFDASGASGSGANGSGAANKETTRTNSGGVRTISRNDQDGMSNNLEDIANGKVIVQ